MIHTVVTVVYDNMPGFGKAANVTLRKGADTTLERVLDRMKVLVPVRTGALRDGLEIVHEGNQGGKEYGGIVSREGHWPFPEYGTRHMVAQPYIAPAVKENLDLFREVMGKEVHNAVLMLAGAAVVG